MNIIPLLAAERLSVGYRRARHPPRVVVEGIDVGLHAGEFVCLLGPNGAGKSTLIRTISGMQKPLAGTVKLAGEPLASLSAKALAQRMSLVLTDRPAVGLMPVATLVAFGRHPYTHWGGRLQAKDREAVWQAMTDVGIESLAHRPVCELSDGERQKAMIARALAQEPRVMVLDEATAFLDLPRRVELVYLLRDLARIGRRAILLATHDLDLALRCADRLWLLPTGSPLLQGVPEDLVLNGAFAEAFAGSGAVFDAGSGAFTLPGDDRGEVALRGDGVSGMWTYRALERAGFRVVAEGCTPLCVEVLQHNGATTWHISGGERSNARIVSLEALLEALGKGE